MTPKPVTPQAKKPATTTPPKKPISKPSINPFAEKHPGKMGRSGVGRNNASLRGGR